MSAERPTPGVTPATEFLRSLRYQAPAEISSLSSRTSVPEIVDYGSKKRFTPEEARQRTLEKNRQWQQSPEGKRYFEEYNKTAGKDARKRYYQSEKGKATRKEASRRWRRNHKQQ